MKFTILTLAAMLGATVVASPTPANDGYVPSASKVFLIKDFTLCKGANGAIDRVIFEVKATDGTNTDFICGPYDPVAREITDCFEQGKVYACSNSSPFTFSYTDSTHTLSLATTGEEFGSLNGSAPVSGGAKGFEIVVYPPQS